MEEYVAGTLIIRKAGALLALLICALAPLGAQEHERGVEPTQRGLPSGAPTEFEQLELPPRCQAPGVIGAAQLNNLSEVLKHGDPVRILSIGASAFSDPSMQRGGPDDALKNILSSTVKGLRFEVINRGVSGELSRQAAERIKLEVALEDPVVVLWQVGTADAFARIPLAEFTETLRSTVRWLKERDVDVVLVGLHYLRQWTRDPYVLSMRKAVRKIAAEEKVLRIGRFEAEELLAKVASNSQGRPTDAFALTEAGYDCMAEYVARAIAVGLYMRVKAPKPGVR